LRIKLEKIQIACIALCVVVLIQTGQIVRIAHLHSDAKWRIDNIQLCHALVAVQDSLTGQRLRDVRLRYTPDARLDPDRDDLMVVSQRKDDALLAVWVGSGLPVKATAISDTHGSADFELQPGIANHVLLVNTNPPAIPDWVPGDSGQGKVDSGKGAGRRGKGVVGGGK